jgi:hypothetical protein
MTVFLVRCYGDAVVKGFRFAECTTARTGQSVESVPHPRKVGIFDVSWGKGRRHGGKVGSPKCVGIIGVCLAENGDQSGTPRWGGVVIRFPSGLGTRKG